jgi:NADH-quinone oxidoreductase subunit J
LFPIIPSFHHSIIPRVSHFGWSDVVTVYGAIFYVLAALIVAATGLAITRRDPIHAVIFLVVSFLGTAMLFYLLGAPFLAGVEVIVYAGAIMVLFLFVIMMLGQAPWKGKTATVLKWGPAVIPVLLFLTVTGLLIIQDPQGSIGLQMAVASPAEFGRFVFERYWLAVEIISFLLLIALVAAIQLRRDRSPKGDDDEVA